MSIDSREILHKVFTLSNNRHICTVQYFTVKKMRDFPQLEPMEKPLTGVHLRVFLLNVHTLCKMHKRFTSC